MPNIDLANGLLSQSQFSGHGPTDMGCCPYGVLHSNSHWAPKISSLSLFLWLLSFRIKMDKYPSAEQVFKEAQGQVSVDTAEPSLSKS